MELHEEDSSATPRAMLGRRLRRLREKAQLSQRGLASAVGYPHTYISRVERGDQLPSGALAEAFDTYFHTDGLFVELLALAQDGLIADYSRKIVAKESEAIRIQVFTSSLVPGLLQTEEYVRESFKLGLPSENLPELDARVVVRKNRAGIFEREEPPLYWAIMDEVALLRGSTSKEVMARQIEHLIQMAERQNITLQVLPFSRGFHPMMGGSLTLLTLRDGSTVALVESFDSGTGVESPKGVLSLIQRFDMARSQALTTDESLDLIRHYLKGYAK
ncbi:helix-turn-helix domain-containing protein [Actinacidiphila sp. ITFR-21]|uniref:helix-turn-helix domain-containing protein n=1 Tax=Actinacidiphila sp. ITFR-21 TaxID=3075199 RepID=UPI00288BAF65|nr:helix-turn-helix transcriptional regulator [Streptomyces sp. ITFR-21]WNI14691.1 helix-turn-helix transcriptional regulator [Streptomyces sp. ITFR-21]